MSILDNSATTAFAVFAVFAVPAFGPELLSDVFVSLALAEEYAFDNNAVDPDHDYRVVAVTLPR